MGSPITNNPQAMIAEAMKHTVLTGPAILVEFSTTEKDRIVVLRFCKKNPKYIHILPKIEFCPCFFGSHRKSFHTEFSFVGSMDFFEVVIFKKTSKDLCLVLP